MGLGLPGALPHCVLHLSSLQYPLSVVCWVCGGFLFWFLGLFWVYFASHHLLHPMLIILQKQEQFPVEREDFAHSRASHPLMRMYPLEEPEQTLPQPRAALFDLFIII